jgi:predicted RNA binding protein YcfA (HicA-like mRNA interferase family)
VPRLSCSFREFVDIIEAHGFTLYRQREGLAQAVSRGDRRVVYFVDVAFHNEKDLVRPGTLKSMIRQSGMPERLFRK